jgi:AcrR family transcriptional regulator
MNFAETLEAERAEAASLRKGERTRAALRHGAVLALNEIGYRDMRVVDICERAGVSKATFWVYFEDKVAITTEVLNQFMDHIRSQRTSAEHRTAYDAIFHSNLLWIKQARANAGLMECLLQFSDEVPEFARIYQQGDHELFKKFAKRIARDFPDQAAVPEDWELTVQVLAAMMDSVTRKLISPTSSVFAETVYALGHDDESFARYLTRLWYVALFGTAPAAE